MSGDHRDRSASGRAADRLPPRAGDSGGRARAQGRARGGDRGQTTLDFAIGVSVFLSVMLFVFAFVPGILQPFNLSGEDDIALSERIASDLSQAKLGNASTPYVLESNCAVQFFDEGDAPPGHCNYEGQELHERLGVSDFRNVNVTMRGALEGGLENSHLCWDADVEKLKEVDGPGDCTDNPDDQILTIGPVPPEANSATVTARRVVSLHEENVTMTVVIW